MRSGESPPSLRTFVRPGSASSRRVTFSRSPASTRAKNSRRGSCPVVVSLSMRALADEARVERDLHGGQGGGDRTALLRRLGLILEGLRVDLRDLGFGVEIDARDPERLADLLQVHLRARLDPLRRKAGPPETGGERHREAAGMRRADQLLGVRPRPALEARRERVGPLEGAAAELHPAPSLLQVAFPDG